MISEVKKYMKEHVIATKEQIIADTELTAEQIETGLSYLIERNYIAERRKDAETACSSCGSASSCSLAHATPESSGFSYYEYVK